MELKLGKFVRPARLVGATLIAVGLLASPTAAETAATSETTCTTSGGVLVVEPAATGSSGGTDAFLMRTGDDLAVMSWDPEVTVLCSLVGVRSVVIRGTSLDDWVAFPLTPPDTAIGVPVRLELGDGIDGVLFESAVNEALSVAATSAQRVHLAAGAWMMNVTLVDLERFHLYSLSGRADRIDLRLADLDEAYADLRGGNDTFYGIDGSDYVVSGTGADQIFTYGGNDYVEDVEGAPRPDQTFKRDVITPGTGDDEIHTVHGIVSYADASGPVTVDLEARTASGAAGNDYVSGVGIIGSAYADQLIGRPADPGPPNPWLPPDVLDGRGGDDVIDGRGGADSITGGPGNDRCVPYPDTIDVTACEST